MESTISSESISSDNSNPSILKLQTKCTELSSLLPLIMQLLAVVLQIAATFDGALLSCSFDL